MHITVNSRGTARLQVGGAPGTDTTQHPCRGAEAPPTRRLGRGWDSAGGAPPGRRHPLRGVLVGPAGGTLRRSCGLGFSPVFLNCYVGLRWPDISAGHCLAGGALAISSVTAATCPQVACEHRHTPPGALSNPPRRATLRSLAVTGRSDAMKNRPKAR